MNFRRLFIYLLDTVAGKYLSKKDPEVILELPTKQHAEWLLMIMSDSLRPEDSARENEVDKYYRTEIKDLLTTLKEGK